MPEVLHGIIQRTGYRLIRLGRIPDNRRIRLGPHSRLSKLALADGRVAEMRLLKKFKRELTTYFGGQPDALMSRLIERAAHLQLRLHLFDIQALTDGELSERNGRQYLAFNNSLTRTLVALAKFAQPPEAKKKPPDKVEQLLRSIGGNGRAQGGPNK